ncbi:MAG TPA: hypothetical protein VGB52_07720 [Actinomycetota bacterium]
MPKHRRALASLVSLLALCSTSLAAHGEQPIVPATPRATCLGEFDKPETGMQGRVGADDVDSGRAAQGYTCNTQQVGHFGARGLTGGAGGYKVHRYVDAAGHECGYYDSTLLFPLDVVKASTDLPGVIVLDMTNPAEPIKTANLVTPAMLSPHESFSINHERGLLAAALANPVFYPGIVDVYDIAQDCRFPVLRSSTPLGVLGHEGNFSPDGNTFWVTSTAGNVVTAVDVSDPTLPSIAWTGEYNFHGITVSDTGTRLYAADLGRDGVTILDVGQVQDRAADPVVTEIGFVTWGNVSIPQHPIPVTIDDRPYLIEIDEFARGTSPGDPANPVGAARIIDISDETTPVVVSDIRLEVHQPENIPAIAGDPGATWMLGGYTGHYCAVPKREDPGIVACSFILSGLRVFDITDPLAPREIAYFNVPVPPPGPTTFPGGTSSSFTPHAAYAMSAPAFVPERNEIWYTDGSFGFYAVRLTNDVWPD